MSGFAGDTFAEVVRLVRRLHNDVNGACATSRDGRLLVPVDPFPLIALLEARLDVKYQATRQDIPSPLRDILQDKYTITLDKRSDMDKVSGIHVRYLDRTEIFQAAQLTAAEGRLVATKEVIHLECDPDRTPEHYTIDISDQILMAMDRSHPVRADTVLNPESYALFGAFEYLFPWYLRSIPEVAQGTHFQIAERFKVPQPMVEMFYSSHYGDLSNALHEQLAG